MDLIHAAGIGMVLVLFGKPEGERAALAAAAREAVMAAILSDPSHWRTEVTPAVMASGLRSSLGNVAVLTPGMAAP